MELKMCTRCVMNNASDDTIYFEDDGTCNYCNYALKRKEEIYFPNSVGNEKLTEMLKKIKESGKGKKYDCLMGISGGLDSAYLAYLGSIKWGLRILAVHIDDGFDTEIAKENIVNLCEACNIELIIEKVDNDEYMDVIKSFIKAEVPGIAIPQDNVLQAYLKIYAKKFKLKYFLSGANFALESILQRDKSGAVAADGVHLKAIHKQYGEIELKNLPVITLFDRYIGQKYINRIITVRPLDYIDYNKDKAIQELKDFSGFNYYGGKHYESIYTKFVQIYYLPKKFGIDKRTSHLSSLIVSGQLTRDEAINELKKPLYEEKQMEQDIDFILSKINMSRDEFDEIMSRPGKEHSEYRMSVLSKLGDFARKYRKFLSD